MEHQLERPITALAYPEGFHSAATRSSASRVGYTTACGLDDRVSSNHDELLSLSRLSVEGGTHPESLLSKLAIASRKLPAEGERLSVKARRAARRFGELATPDVSGGLSTRRPGWNSPDVDSETPG